MRRVLGTISCCLVLASAATGEDPLGPPWKRRTIDNASRGADGVRLADVNGDGLPDIATGWEQGGAIRLAIHPGPNHVKETWPAVTVGNVPGVEDAVCADLDGDGAADVISCAEGKSRVISIHWAPSDNKKLLDAAAWQTQSLPASVGAMMWMFALPMQIDDQNGIDLVAGGKNQGAAIGWFAAPTSARALENWQWHKLRDVGWLMSLVSSDMDADGDQDIVFSDRKGPHSGAFWLENPGRDWHDAANWREHPIGGAGSQAMFLHVADLDRDGLEDVLLAVQPREILWLKRLDKSGQNWRTHAIPLPDSAGIAKAVNVADVDGDGHLDIVFSCEQAKPPLHGLMWLSHAGSPETGPWTPHTLSGADGVKHDLIALLDLDADGDLDAITTEEVNNLGVIWYENPTKGPRTDGQ
jgi:hypothetical protein